METSSQSSSQAPQHHHIKPIYIILIFAAIMITLIIGFLAFHQHTTPPTPNPDEAALDIPGSAKPYRFDYSWSERHPYVAHAMGGIYGTSYTNSYEAFLLNYQMGQRVFEVDLNFTDDNVLVLSHNRPENDQEEFLAEDYLSALIDDKYHRLSYEDLIKILTKYPDIYIITDTKEATTEIVHRQLAEIVRLTEKVDADLLDRLIIQIYQPEMLDDIMQLYPWRSVIYTLYLDPNWTPENVKSFAETSGVKYVTMWGNWVTPEILSAWQPIGIKVAAHTVNDLKLANQLRALGVSNIYTDFLLP